MQYAHLLTSTSACQTVTKEILLNMWRPWNTMYVDFTEKLLSTQKYQTLWR